MTLALEEAAFPGLFPFKAVVLYPDDLSWAVQKYSSDGHSFYRLCRALETIRLKETGQGAWSWEHQEKLGHSAR